MQAGRLRGGRTGSVPGKGSRSVRPPHSPPRPPHLSANAKAAFRSRLAAAFRGRRLLGTTPARDDTGAAQARPRLGGRNDAESTLPVAPAFALMEPPAAPAAPPRQARTSLPATGSIPASANEARSIPLPYPEPFCLRPSQVRASDSWPGERTGLPPTPGRSGRSSVIVQRALPEPGSEPGSARIG